MKSLFFLIFLFCFCSSSSFATEQMMRVKNVTNISLAELERAVISAPGVESELALLEEIYAQLEHEREISGWKIVGGASGGYTSEQLTTDERKEYYPARVTAGLTHPLFGKYKDEKSNLLELEAGAQNEYLKVEIKRRDALEQLRLSYIMLWGVEKQIGLTEAFLSSKEDDRKLLKRRKDKGLLLGSDYLDFVTVFDRVERERKVNMNAAERARDIIEMLTNIRVAVPLMFAPDVPKSCESVAEGMIALDQNPEISLYQNMVELQLKKERYASSDIKGNVTVSGFASSAEDVNTDLGYGGLVSLDLVMPLNPFAADSRSQVVSQKRLRRYQKQLKAKTQEVRFDLTDRLRNLESELAKQPENLTQLTSATELLREKALRLERAEGDVLEQYQQARYRYYRAAMDFVDGEVRLLQSATQVLRFCPEEPVRTSWGSTESSVIRPLTHPAVAGKVLGERITMSPQAAAEVPVTAVYWWDTNQLFTPSFSPVMFKDHGVDKVLISFNQKQLQYIETAEGAMNLRRVMAEFKANGLTVSLLLGEPTWLLPEFRPRLMTILQSVNTFNFASIHLDMEPFQLDVGKYGLEYLSAQFLRTITSAIEISVHPIEISIHPRMLDKRQTKICFGCGVSNLPLKRVVVMAYRTDVQSVTQQMASFATAYPTVNFAVAQSVEPTLGVKNSYAHSGDELFERVRQAFLQDSGQVGWHGDVYIQDWASYVKMINVSDTP